MPVIALVGNKGGAGKTTLAVNLAAGLARHDSVAVIDADPQGSALQWRAIAADASARFLWLRQTCSARRLSFYRTTIAW